MKNQENYKHKVKIAVSGERQGNGTEHELAGDFRHHGVLYIHVLFICICVHICIYIS